MEDRWEGLARWATAGAAGVCVVGAFAHWGAISDIAEQAALVGTTRTMVAILAAMAGALVLASRSRPWLALGGPAPFLLVAVIVFGEADYEGLQAHYGGVASRPIWLQVTLAAALLGAVTSTVTLALGVRRRRAVSTRHG